MAETKAPAPKIVEAAGTSVGAKHLTAKMIEEAMAQAVVDCAKEGVIDPDEIRKRKLAAREQIKRA